MPAMDSFPVGRPIPISLRIATYTKSMKYSKTPSSLTSAAPSAASSTTKLRSFLHSSESELFPDPPTEASTITFQLDSRVRVKAQGQKAKIHDHLRQLGGFGPAPVKVPSPLGTEVQITVDDPVWIPETKGSDPQGVWKREVQFDTNIVLVCSPTVKVEDKLSCDVSHHVACHLMYVECLCQPVRAQH
jgi:hypothetical protein